MRQPWRFFILTTDCADNIVLLFACSCNFWRGNNIIDKYFVKRSKFLEKQYEVTIHLPYGSIFNQCYLAGRF